MIRRISHLIQYAEDHVYEVMFFKLRIGQIDVNDKFRNLCEYLLCREDSFPDDPLTEFREEGIRLEKRYELQR